MGGAIVRGLQAKGQDELTIIDPAMPDFRDFSGVSVLPDMMLI